MGPTVGTHSPKIQKGTKRVLDRIHRNKIKGKTMIIEREKGQNY